MERRTHASRRIYVKVHADFDATGYMQPRAVVWADGRVFPIEQVRDLRPLQAAGPDGCECYTVLIRGQERLLFFQRTDPRFASRVGRWFFQRPGGEER